VALGVAGTTLNSELNRLANGGTYRIAADMVDMALAAQQWASQRSKPIGLILAAYVITSLALLAYLQRLLSGRSLPDEREI